MARDDYEGIIVLGAPRSGTTLMRRVLDAHPHISCPPETNVLNACARFLQGAVTAQGLRLGVLDGLAFSGISEARVLDTLREMAFGYFREIRDVAGKARWAEKTAFDVFHLDAIEQLVGDRCQYICICRHGFDAVVSTKELCDEMDCYQPELHVYLQRYPSPLEALAHAWTDVNVRLLRFAEEHSQSCLWVRYEDLVANPAPALERIFSFLGEPVDVQAMLGAIFGGKTAVGLGDWKGYATSGFSTQSVGRGKNLPPRAASAVAAIVNPTLVSLGYEAVQAPVTPDPVVLRQRYRAMKMVKLMQARSASPQSDVSRPD